MPECRKCGVELTEENWYPSYRKGNSRICKKCDRERQRVWRETNPKMVRAQQTRAHRRQGAKPFNENKDCGQYLGVHIAERVLSHVFKDVHVMPHGNPGYDFICSKGMKIDVKSSCLQKAWRTEGWKFHIRCNTTPDYFLCMAFDNREDLHPLYAWLLPGNKFNHFIGIGISPSTIYKWDAYKLDISKISDCCDAMR